MAQTPAPVDYLKQQTFVAFDTETTGMWAPINRVVEIAAVKFSLDSGEMGSFQSLVNPQRQIPPEVIRIHGITDEMVQDSPTAEQAMEQFMTFCGADSILVAHNAPFDISFVGSELHRTGLKFGPNPILDTVDIYHRFFPGLPSYSLLNLSKHFGIAQSQEHRALSDAILVHRLVAMAEDKLIEIHSLDDLEKLLTVHRMDAWQPESAPLPDEFADLQQAIDSGRKVEIDYNHPVKSSATRIIHPRHVFKLGSIFYINGYCELAKGERTFRMDRILRYEVLADQAGKF